MSNNFFEGRINIIISFVIRFASGLLPLLVIFILDKSSGVDIAAVYIYVIGLASLISNFSQGYMPVYFASKYSDIANQDCKNLIFTDYLLSLSIFIVVSLCILFFSFWFNYELLVDNFYTYLFFGFSFVNITALAKYCLNKGSVNKFVFISVALPSVVVLLVLGFTFVTGVGFNLYYLCLALPVVSISFLFHFFIKYEVIKRGFFKFLNSSQDFKERVLRGLLAVIEQLDIIILSFVGFNELVFFAYIKRVMGVGSIASSMITKTFEKQIANQIVDFIELRKIKILIAFFQLGFVIFVYFVASNLNVGNLELLVAAGLISIAHVLVSGKVVSILISGDKTNKAIISSFILIISVILYFYFSERTVIDFCIVFIAANLGKVFVLNKVAK